MSEEELIEGCIRNNRKAQRAFVDQYSPYLAGVCRRYVSDTGRAKDCLQDGLVQVLTNMDKYKNTGSFKSWAAKVTANICLQHIRKEKKHINFDVESRPEMYEDEVAHLQLEVNDMLTFLDTIPEKYRIAVNMYVIEGYSHKEVSIHLGITESSSRSLVTRGRKMVQTAFEEEKSRIINIRRGDSYTSNF